MVQIGARCEPHELEHERARVMSSASMASSRVSAPATAPADTAAPSTTPSDLAWRVIGLLSLYRLLVPLLLLAMHSLVGPDWGLVPAGPKLFVSACIIYFTAAVLLVIARRLKWSSLRIVALVNASVDTIAIGLILYASGGVASGLGILLVLPVLSLTVLANRRDALLIAAVAALGVLAQQLFTGFSGGTPAADYTTAGVLGLLLFVVALASWPVANRLRESEALVRRQEIDLANLAQLSQYIVQHLRESILVIDPQDRIRLINESAAQILGDQRAYPDALIGEASPRLLFLLESWRQGARTGSPPHDPRPFRAARREQPGPAVDLPRGHEPARRQGAAIQARLTRSIECQHRSRDPHSRGSDEPRRAVARGIAALERGGATADRDHPQPRRPGERHHR
jgi:PAS domain-containing protein